MHQCLQQNNQAFAQHQTIQWLGLWVLDCYAELLEEGTRVQTVFVNEVVKEEGVGEGGERYGELFTRRLRECAHRLQEVNYRGTHMKFPTRGR